VICLERHYELAGGVIQSWETRWGDRNGAWFVDFQIPDGSETSGILDLLSAEKVEPGPSKLRHKGYFL